MRPHPRDAVEALPRLLRQVHRVLKPGGPFVVAMTHPVAAMFGADPSAKYAYGAASPTFAELYLSLIHISQPTKPY